MPRTKAELLERRPDIVSAAQKIFHERGFGATSIQEIADAVGLLKGSLYHYIDAKEDLLYAIVFRVHSEMAAQWESADPGPGDDVARLRAFIRAHVLFITRDLEGVSVFLHEFRSLDEKRRRQIVRKRNRYEALLSELVAAAQSASPDDPATALQTYSIFGMMNWVAQWYRPTRGLDADEVADGIADMSLRMLGLASSSDL